LAHQGLPASVQQQGVAGRALAFSPQPLLEEGLQSLWEQAAVGSAEQAVSLRLQGLAFLRGLFSLPWSVRGLGKEVALLPSPDFAYHRGLFFLSE